MRSECRAFSEEDLDSAVCESFTSANMKLNEYLYRRVNPEDAVNACSEAAKCTAVPASPGALSAWRRPLRRTIPRIDAPLIVRAFFSSV